MLESLQDIDDILLFGLWCISAFLIIASVLVSIWLSVRRVYRNRRDAIVNAHQAEFESLLQKLLGTELLAREITLPDHIRHDRTAVTTALLKFFKLVRGDDAAKLRQIVKELQLEPIVITATRYGNRGKRMRAQHVLSFLESSTSLKTIADRLYADDKYIRLSVARCLARRRVMSLISEVSEAIAFAFPKEDKLLTDVLYRFGSDAIPRFERMVSQSKDATVIAGVLETLILLRPENTTINFSDLITHEDERVRAAIVQLSTICKGDYHQDLLLEGLKDESRKVKIRALKMAAKSKRSDSFAQVHRLMEDPFMWIRYWAMRSAMTKGHSGNALLRTLARREGMVGMLADDVLQES